MIKWRRGRLERLPTRYLDLSHLDRVPARSVHPSEADIRRLHRHVRFVPILLQKLAVVDGCQSILLRTAGIDPPA
jgi:hypothetical protein